MVDLQKSFLAFAQKHKMQLATKRTLIAVSGGVDSIVLCDLFASAGFEFAIAHCNFQLRENDSVADELFCKSLAEKYKVPFFTIAFDTLQYAAENKIGIQEAARNLRYAWFEKIKNEQKYFYLATAHHANDNAETILYNIIKGTGIKGLRGIVPNKNRLIRPLLFAKKEEIQAYQIKNELAFREDKSNESDKYNRNKIRLNIIPEIEKINPSFVNTINVQSEYFSSIEKIEEKQHQLLFKKIIKQQNGESLIGIKALQKAKNPIDFLFHFLKEFGFSFSQCENILATIESTETKQFFSQTHQLLKTKKNFVLAEKNEIIFSPILIESWQDKLVTPQGELLFSRVDKNDLVIDKNKNVAYFDEKELQFPLLIRNIKTADYFYPFGMNGKKKKTSKYFKDLKFDLNQKKRALILFSGERVCWLIDERIDDRFKMTDNTKKVVVIRWNSSK